MIVRSDEPPTPWGILRDKSLPFEVRGFLVYLLGKPDAWEFRPNEIAEEIGIGRATVYRYFKILIQARLATRDEIVRRNEHGKFQEWSNYTIFETPIAKTNGHRPRVKGFKDDGIPF